MRIKVNEHGFPLRGADQNGRCYYVRNTFGINPDILEDNELSFANIIAETVDEPLYFEDPVLSFSKS